MSPLSLRGYAFPYFFSKINPVTRPSVPSDWMLPFKDLGGKTFEKLLLDLVGDVFTEIDRPSFKGINGVRQFGVDVEGFNRAGFPEVVVSAKCRQHMSASDLREWCDEFIVHLDGHWKGKNVKHFVLAVAVDTNNDPVNDGIRTISARLAEYGIQFHVWDRVKLSKLISGRRSLILRYFDECWARRSPTPRPRRSAPLGVMLTGIATAAFYLAPLTDQAWSDESDWLGPGNTQPRVCGGLARQSETTYWWRYVEIKHMSEVSGFKYPVFRVEARYKYSCQGTSKHRLFFWRTWFR